MAALNPFKKFAALGSFAGGFCRRDRRHRRPGGPLHGRHILARPEHRVVQAKGQMRSTVLDRIQLLSSSLRNFMSSRTTVSAWL